MDAFQRMNRGEMKMKMKERLKRLTFATKCSIMVITNSTMRKKDEKIVRRTMYKSQLL